MPGDRRFLMVISEYRYGRKSLYTSMVAGTVKLYRYNRNIVINGVECTLASNLFYLLCQKVIIGLLFLTRSYIERERQLPFIAAIFSLIFWICSGTRLKNKNSVMFFHFFFKIEIETKNSKTKKYRLKFKFGREMKF